MPASLKPRLLVLALLSLSLPALAITLEEATAALSAAKASGLVGEQPDGYLGTPSANAQGSEIASRINQARRTEYQRLATQNNISLQAVEQLAGQKAIDKTASGHYIQRGGTWVKK